jgi:hypothetical protein
MTMDKLLHLAERFLIISYRPLLETEIFLDNSPFDQFHMIIWIRKKEWKIKVYIGLFSYFIILRRSGFMIFPQK